MARDHWTVYRLYDSSGVLLYVGCTSSLITRVQQHASYQDWAQDIVSVKCEHYDRKQAALDREQELIRRLGPQHNSWPREERRRPPCVSVDDIPDMIEDDTPPVFGRTRNWSGLVVSSASRFPAFGRSTPGGKVHVVNRVNVHWHDNGTIHASAACGRGLSIEADRPSDEALCQRCARSTHLNWLRDEAVA